MVFQKTNKVFINDAHWSVTFVHDLKPFSNLISKIKNDLAHVEEILKAITNFYERSNLMVMWKRLKVCTLRQIH